MLFRAISVGRYRYKWRCRVVLNWATSQWLIMVCKRKKSDNLAKQKKEPILFILKQISDMKLQYCLSPFIFTSVFRLKTKYYDQKYEKEEKSKMGRSSIPDVSEENYKLWQKRLKTLWVSPALSKPINNIEFLLELQLLLLDTSWKETFFWI